ncbi:GSCOCG00009484001-RA-CDS [Cotesia congregata]|nr:GSCOCG00009484001-RA-CDS [Cotesia congregata]
MDYAAIDEISRADYPNNNLKNIQYGTAGFRMRAELIPHVVYRMGVLSVLRSKFFNGAAIGLMITASHNEEPDNGIKIVDPAGEMLEADWEKIATEFARVPDSELIDKIKKIIREKNIDENAPALIVIGRDTRESGVSLSQAAVKPIKFMKAVVKDFGVITTPQLHYLVVCINTKELYGVATIEGYFDKLSSAFKKIQTAYANGASTNYVTETLKVPVAFTETGVKHLHHQAQQFDIGVYFEANGHGTAIVKDEIVKMIREFISDKNVSSQQRSAMTELSNFIDIINQAVGDALSDMLLVETILYAKDWDIVTWKQCYSDFPNKQLKVKVVDRNIIKTTDAERQCTSPMGLQDKIDQLVSQYPKGRSFVRPSGTEDIIRVYTECQNQTDVDKLAAQVALAVYEYAGGVGEKPIVP